MAESPGESGGLSCRSWESCGGKSGEYRCVVGEFFLVEFSTLRCQRMQTQSNSNVVSASNGVDLQRYDPLAVLKSPSSECVELLCNSNFPKCQDDPG